MAKESPLAGKPAPASLLVDVGKLVAAYHNDAPDPGNPDELVAFGTSGHRGSSFHRTFNEAHILAITQAIVEHRMSAGIDGPLYLGKDTHALSAPAERTALEVLAAHGVQTIIARNDGITPTPVISHAIITYNHRHSTGLADGIVVTPSHNPPEDGGFKYNPPHGGPADADVTNAIQDRANALLRGGNQGVKRIPYEHAIRAETTRAEDLISPYVDDLGAALDLDAIRAAGVKMGVDPLGGAALPYWQAIAERWRLDLTVVNTKIDPQFGFMTVDHDGKIRMDCSSPAAMASLIGLKDRFTVAFGNDADSDRHGIVTPSAGLLNPNHYLAVAIDYLAQHRPAWPAEAGVGKTLVSSSLIDRVVAALGRPLVEVPVGFKWFVPGLSKGTLLFGGEESAGASFLRRDGSTWTTDKDGLLLALLAGEITAVTGKDPGQLYQELTARFGAPVYKRIDQPASAAVRTALKKLAPTAVRGSTLAGDPITATLTEAPGNGAALGGLKVVTGNGWFAARPSGTEAIYKIYAESFRGAEHLDAIITEATAIVAAATGA